MKIWDTRYIQTNTGKLATYRILKQNFNIEPYLLQISCKDERQNYTKLRASNHVLGVETGRHRRIIVPFEERICNQCNLCDVEDETHFVLKCEKYSTKRCNFKRKIENIIPSFDQQSDRQKLRVILGSSDYDIYKIAINYINEIYNERKSQK